MPTTLYEKVIAVFGMLRNSIDQKTSKLDLAPLFNTSVNYPVDSLVVYENVLYVCTTAHSGEWDADDFATATIDDILRLKAKKADFAPEYSDTASYEKNQLVIKNGAFMECTVAGYGDEAQFQNATVAQVVARLDNAIKQAAAISQVYAILENIVPKYAVYTNYAVGDRCSYNGRLYECTEAVYASSSTPDDTFWSTYWKTITVEEMLAGYVKSGSNASLQSLTMKDSSGPAADGPTITIGTANRLLVIDKLGVTVSDETGEDAQRIYFGTSKSGTVALLEDLAPNITTLQPDSSGKIVFKAGQMLVYGNELYLCTTGYSVDAASEDPVWVEANWTECTIDAVLDIMMDMLTEVVSSVSKPGEMDVSAFLTPSVGDIVSNNSLSSLGITYTSYNANVRGIVLKPQSWWPSGLLQSVTLRARSSGSDLTGVYLYVLECLDGTPLTSSGSGRPIAMSEQFNLVIAQDVNIELKNPVQLQSDKTYVIVLSTNDYSAKIGSYYYIQLQTDSNSSGTQGVDTFGVQTCSNLASESQILLAGIKPPGLADQAKRFFVRCQLSFSASEDNAQSGSSGAIEAVPIKCVWYSRNFTGSDTSVDLPLPDMSDAHELLEVRYAITVGSIAPTITFDANNSCCAPVNGNASWRSLSPHSKAFFVFKSMGLGFGVSSDRWDIFRLWIVESTATLTTNNSIASHLLSAAATPD